MDGISEAPDENQRRRHDDAVRVVDAIVKRHLLAHRHGDDAADRRMPVDARHCLVLTELQVGE